MAVGDENTPLNGEVAAAGVQWLGVVAATLGRIEQTVLGQNTRLDGQNDRIDRLIETTNHRMDDFRAEMQRRSEEQDEFITHTSAAAIEYQKQVAQALDGKASKTELVQSVIRTSRPVQIVLAAVALALGPTVVANWDSFIVHLTHIRLF